MQTPGAFEPAPPSPAPISMQAALPQIVLDAAPVTVSELKPRRRSRRPSPGSLSVPAVETPVAEDSSAAPTADEVLGALSPGGDSPITQGQAASNIASVEKRLGLLAADQVKRKPREVSQVRQFLKQARSALKMGDVEGAKNLSTKAGLLLDDVQQ